MPAAALADSRSSGHELNVADMQLVWPPFCNRPSLLRHCNTLLRLGATMQLRANALQYVGDPEAPRPAWKGLSWRSLLSLKWRQDDNESIFCYVLFMALFVADFSFLAMVFPIVLYVYALLAQAPATRFWQVNIHASCHLSLYEC